MCTLRSLSPSGGCGGFVCFSFASGFAVEASNPLFAATVLLLRRRPLVMVDKISFYFFLSLMFPWRCGLTSLQVHHRLHSGVLVVLFA